MFPMQYFQNGISKYYSINDVCQNTVSVSKTELMFPLKKTVVVAEILKWNYFKHRVVDPEMMFFE